MDINGSIAYTKTTSIDMGASYTVPSGVLGWLQWGSWGYSYGWKHYQYSASCGVVLLGSGTAKTPAQNPGFNHSN